MPQEPIIKGLPQKKDEVESSFSRCWPIRHKLTMIDGVAIEVKQIIIPFALLKKILDTVAQQ